MRDYIENRSIESSNQLRTLILSIFMKEFSVKKEVKKGRRQTNKINRLASRNISTPCGLRLVTIKEANRRGILISEDLTKITLRSLVFKHDFDAGDEED